MAHGVKLDGMSIEDLRALAEDVRQALSEKVDAERQELLKRLSALDAISAPGKGSNASKKRAAARADSYEGPEGETWAGRGGLPKWAEKYGVTDRAGMEKFKKG